MTSNIKQVIRQLVSEWQTRPLPTIKPRQLSIGDWFSEPLYKIITVVGFRRVGKTFILLDFAAKLGMENCLYLNMEDERLPKKTEVLTELLNVVREVYGEKRPVLLVDEIQEIPDWSRWARRVNENRLYHLVLTGSSSRLSSAEIPTELRGRTITKHVFPLSFTEFKNWKETSDELHLLREYLTFGGFPEIVLAEEGKKPILLDEYFQTFLLRDIIERYRPRQEAAIRDLISLLVNSPYYTIGKLTQSLTGADYQIGKGTVAHYLDYLKTSYFFRPLEIHTAKVKSRIQHPKKAYFIDNFFISRLAGKFSENYGRPMEQAVAQSLFQSQTANPNLDIYYWKSPKDQEVDFVIRESLKVTELIQVCFVSSVLEIPLREKQSLVRASRELKCDRLTLITWDLQGEIEFEDKTIKCQPLAQRI